jgi:anti-sigma regulatory factor (Ser/Thr protein kinase)
VTDSAEFPATPDSIAAARRFVAAALGAVDQDGRDAVSLMVSELATNSVRHARTPYRVAVLRRGDAVRVEVSDHGSGRALLREPGPREPHGRGMRIVARLAEAWGVELHPNAPGKTTWFTYRIEGAPSGPG